MTTKCSNETADCRAADNRHHTQIDNNNNNWQLDLDNGVKPWPNINVVSVKDVNMDDGLEAIRQKRMAELQAQQGGDQAEKQARYFFFMD